MVRKVAFLAAAALASLVVAQAASAGVSCSTDAAAEVASATVVDRGSGWSQPGQPDLWSVSVPDLNMSVDLYAADEASARSAAQSFIEAEIAAACAAEDPAGDPSPPIDGAAAPSSAPSSPEAEALIADATVTYRGYAWSSASQPLPLWSVSVPSLNMTVDVYAADEAGARQAALPTVTAALGAQGTPAAPTAAPSAPESPSAPSDAASEQTTSTTSTTSTVTVSATDASSAARSAPTGSTNPLLAGALTRALGRPVTVQSSTTCILGAKVVPCRSLFAAVRVGRTVKVTMRGQTARRIVVQAKGRG